MRTPTRSEGIRRSSRVQLTMPIQVTSLEPSVAFSETCETLVVNAHGCAVRSPKRLDAGVPLHFQNKRGRRTRARVVDCQPLGSDRGWKVAARLERPENFWGLRPCPEDWTSLPQAPEAADAAVVVKAEPPRMPMLRALVSEAVAPLEAEIERLKTKLAESADQKSNAPDLAPLEAEIAALKNKIAEQGEHRTAASLPGLAPLQAEVHALQAKLAEQEERRKDPAQPRANSSFEISLSHIPPEVEEKLWIRLRQDLGTQVLQQTREQSEQLLGSTQSAIAEKLTEAERGFEQRASRQVKELEQRAHELAQGVDGEIQQQVRTGTQTVEQHASDAGRRLEREGDEFLRAVQQRLAQEHAVQRREMEEARTAFTAQASGLQAQLADLAERVTRLQDSAAQLEAETGTRMADAAAKVVSSARAEIENSASTILSAHMSRLDAEIAQNVLPMLSRSETMLGDIRSTTEILRQENQQAAQQIAAIGEQKQQFRQWLDEQAAAYQAELREQLQQKIRDAAAGAAAQLQAELKTALTAHLEGAKSELNATLAPLLERAQSLERSLIQETGAWLAQQGADFRKTQQEKLEEATAKITWAVEEALAETTRRSAGELERQVAESSERLRQAQQAVEASAGESLGKQATERLQSFETTMEKLALGSVDRWRGTLARELKSIAESLAQRLGCGAEK